MKKLFLHVGPHKTGTTLIQKFMLDNSAQLFKSNIVYPKRFLKFFGHHDFRDKAAQRILSQEDVDFINNNEHDWLLSSENFISLDKDALEYMKKLFNNKKIIILYSWRRASYKLYSIWQEEIKHGKTESFYEYYHDHLARPGLSAMLAPDLKLNIFSQVFGKSSIRIIDYDTSLKNNSLLADFCSVIGVRRLDGYIEVESNPHARNESLEDTDVEILRGLNSILKSTVYTRKENIRNQYLRSRKKLERFGLLELKNIIKSSITEHRVGDYQIDVRSERIMVEKYSENIINYEPNLKAKAAYFPNSEWVFNTKGHKIITDIASHISKELEAKSEE